MNKILLVGTVLLFLGLFFILLGEISPSYVDKDGFLHDSSFLPLGALSFFIGIIAILFFCIKKIILVIFSKL